MMEIRIGCLHLDDPCIDDRPQDFPHRCETRRVAVLLHNHPAIVCLLMTSGSSYSARRISIRLAFSILSPRPAPAVHRPHQGPCHRRPPVRAGEYQCCNGEDQVFERRAIHASSLLLRRQTTNQNERRQQKRHERNVDDFQHRARRSISASRPRCTARSSWRIAARCSIKRSISLCCSSLSRSVPASSRLSCSSVRPPLGLGELVLQAAFRRAVLCLGAGTNGVDPRESPGKACATAHTDEVRAAGQVFPGHSRQNCRCWRTRWRSVGRKSFAPGPTSGLRADPRLLPQ